VIGPNSLSEIALAIEREMESLSSEGWLERTCLEQALRRVARRAFSSAMSRAGLGADSKVAAGG
jgi:hypothetical protein